MKQMGKLMMNGNVEQAAASGSLDAISFLKTFNDSAIASLKDDVKLTADPLVKKNRDGSIVPTVKSEFKTVAGTPRLGQFPLSEMASTDKNTYYQLWMNDSGDMVWYSIDKANYTANKDAWKPVKR